jgi:hypothetical protein
MDIIYDDEFNAPKFIPKIPMKRNPSISDTRSLVEFLSKEERDKIHKQEEEKKNQELKKKEIQNTDHRKIYQAMKYLDNKNGRKEGRDKRKRSRSRDKDLEKKKSSQIENKEVEAIKVYFNFTCRDII